ncbi:MAG TPA: glycosyltransferase 87 family protein [Actinomycetota bacterium]|nr:glycosyltransferase 87 family protein [Actinomycetota bacterium]
MLIVCTLFVAMGYLLKAQCLGPGNFGARSYKDLCYNDLQPLYGARLFRPAEDGTQQRVFPYVDGAVIDGELVDGAIEYPVLTGLFMYASGLLVEDADAWLRISAVLLAPLALLVAYLLVRMAGARAFMWAAAPALILYAFHNWDLLVVACAVAGFWFWRRGSPLAAAVLFGVGAAFKMYPIFFLAPLGLDYLMRGDRKEAIRSVVAGVGAFLAVNLPFFVMSPGGWFTTYAFHNQRGPNFDTIWCVMRDTCRSEPFWEPAELNRLTLVLTVVSFLGVLAYAWSRGRREGTFPGIQTAAALLAVFLLWNKVHSPQYTLWLLPMFALVRVNLAWWVAYSLADLAVYVGVFRWFYEFSANEQDLPALGLMQTGVWARAALLFALIVVFLRSVPATPDEGARLALGDWLGQPLRRPAGEDVTASP